MRPVKRMFVSLGTDHHPFVRLVDWVSRWAAENPEWEVHMQHGSSPAPSGCHAFAFCDHDQLQELMRTSDVVVSHGGPATITEARRRGHLPVVVPRDPRLGEHVDDHQQLFSRRLGGYGLVRLAQTEDDFRAAVREVARGQEERERAVREHTVPEGVFCVGGIVEELVRTRSRAAVHGAGGPRRRLRGRLRRWPRAGRGDLSRD
jgi:UDP-N-acetylglucosamine transferase subunit ALG13